MLRLMARAYWLMGRVPNSSMKSSWPKCRREATRFWPLVSIPASFRGLKHSKTTSICGTMVLRRDNGLVLGYKNINYYKVITTGEEYGIPEGYCYSMPVRCRGFEYEIVKDLLLSETQKIKLMNSLRELKHEKDAASENWIYILFFMDIV